MFTVDLKKAITAGEYLMKAMAKGPKGRVHMVNMETLEEVMYGAKITEEMSEVVRSIIIPDDVVESFVVTKDYVVADGLKIAYSEEENVPFVPCKGYDVDKSAFFYVDNYVPGVYQVTGGKILCDGNEVSGTVMKEGYTGSVDYSDMQNKTNNPLCILQFNADYKAFHTCESGVYVELGESEVASEEASLEDVANAVPFGAVEEEAAVAASEDKASEEASAEPEVSEESVEEEPEEEMLAELADGESVAIVLRAAEAEYISKKLAVASAKNAAVQIGVKVEDGKAKVVLQTGEYGASAVTNPETVVRVLHVCDTAVGEGQAAISVTLEMLLSLITKLAAWQKPIRLGFGKATLRVSMEETAAELPSVEGKFAKFDKEEALANIQFDTEEILTVANTAKVFVAGSEAQNKAMTYMCLKLAGGSVCAYALDGYQLYSREGFGEYRAAVEGKEYEVIINPAILARIAAVAGEQKLRVQLFDKTIKVRTSTAEFVVRRADVERFANVESVIKNYNKGAFSFKCEKKALVDHLDLVMLTSQRDDFVISETGVKMSAVEGKNTTLLPAKVSAKQEELVRVDGRRLQKILSVMKDGTIEVLGKGHAPKKGAFFTLKQAGDKKSLFLLLGIAINK